jgi:hypothetical protein
MNQFLSGATMMGCLVAALFFLRFFRETGDRLFAMFAAAFVILGLNRIANVVFNPADEVSPVFYVVRLLAFVLILIAIVDKNRGRPRSGRR